MKKSRRIKKDEKVLIKFITIYCKEHHLKKGKHEFKQGMCKECFELFEYAIQRNIDCPLDPKPQCKHCRIHCYKPDMKQRIKDVMKFSGLYLIKHGRIDMILHYLF